MEFYVKNGPQINPKVAENFKIFQIHLTLLVTLCPLNLQAGTGPSWCDVQVSPSVYTKNLCIEIFPEKSPNAEENFRLQNYFTSKRNQLWKQGETLRPNESIGKTERAKKSGKRISTGSKLTKISPSRLGKFVFFTENVKQLKNAGKRNCESVFFTLYVAA